MTQFNTSLLALTAIKMMDQAVQISPSRTLLVIGGLAITSGVAYIIHTRMYFDQLRSRANQDADQGHSVSLSTREKCQILVARVALVIYKWTRNGGVFVFLFYVFCAVYKMHRISALSDSQISIVSIESVQKVTPKHSGTTNTTD